MNPSDRELILMVQEFLLSRVLQDATAAAYHDLAYKLYTVLHLRVGRARPFLEHYLKWQKSPENAVRDNPKAELMVYHGLFPGRTLDLLQELLT